MRILSIWCWYTRVSPRQQKYSLDGDWTFEKEKEEEEKKETSDGHGNRFKLMLISHGAQKEMLLH